MYCIKKLFIKYNFSHVFDYHFEVKALPLGSIVCAKIGSVTNTSENLLCCTKTHPLIYFHGKD